jgi:hypothetical protein
MRRRLRLLRRLSRAEWRELLVACAWQVRLRTTLVRNRGAVARLASIARRRRRIVRYPLRSEDIERLARWSGVLCRGSCLTNAFVHEIIAARHGLHRPVTIGVALEGTTLRAHAWAGTDEGARAFVSVWADGQDTRP